MSDTGKDRFVVGEKWLFKPKERRNSNRWLKVTKVGRRYVHFDSPGLYVDFEEDGIDSNLVRSKGYGFDGLLFRSDEDHELYDQLQKLRERFASVVTSRYFCFKLTEQQIIEAAKILGIDLEKNE